MPRDLFPPLEPYATGMLPVDGMHTVYWEECGNPNGKPIVFLHGGPGTGCTETHRRFFDPTAWRIILLDQRGSGRSTPFGETKDNTTQHLIGDIEKIRELRGIERWHIFGGSWGSTLALAYAQTHPTRCLSLTLRGIFLMRQKEIDWFLYGIGKIFPEAWETFANFIAPEERHDLLAAYQHIFAGPDSPRRTAAMAHWLDYETSCSALLPSLPQPVSLGPISALPIMEAHYFAHCRFARDAQLLEDVDRIRHIPAVIVQGRYDIVCPIATAHELHKAWPEADYRVISDAGHSALEPGIRSALIAATEKFKSL